MWLEPMAWRKLEANWLTVSMVMPLAAPLIAVAWADWGVSRIVLWGAYIVGIPISAGTVRLITLARRKDVPIATGLVAYCIALTFTHHASALETLAPAVAALSSAAIVARLYRAS
jgi:hypothetical protein